VGGSSEIKELRQRLVDCNCKIEALEKQVNGMVIQPEETDPQQQLEKEKLQEAHFEVCKSNHIIQQLQQNKQYMCHLAHMLLTCRLPSLVYAVYLKGQKILLQLGDLAADNPSYVVNANQFLQLYFNSEENNKNLPCKLYQHNLLLDELHDWDLDPHVGDT
jgi:hypothetical protein